MSTKLLKLIVPVIVLVAGVAAAAFIVSARKAPPRQERPPMGPLVDVMEAETADVQVTVAGHGEVVPKVAIDVVPQVGGRIVSVHPSLVAGGFFRAGEPLVVIEPRDYELALATAEAQVAQAQAALEQELAQFFGTPGSIVFSTGFLATMGMVSTLVGPGDPLLLDDGELDLAIFNLVLHYVVDPSVALAEAHRALRPGADRGLTPGDSLAQSGAQSQSVGAIVSGVGGSGGASGGPQSRSTRAAQS